LHFSVGTGANRKTIEAKAFRTEFKSIFFGITVKIKEF